MSIDRRRHPHAQSDGAYRRDLPIAEAVHAAMLVIDVQRYSAVAGAGCHAEVDPAAPPDHLRYFFERIDSIMLPNIARLQRLCRAKGVEVLFTVVEALTRDGRDTSLDYRISGIHVPRGSPDAHVLPQVAPAEDEIVLPKTTSSVFNSTAIAQLLRNLDVRQLIVTGMLTDQCVISAVRDACDQGFLVTLVDDACTTYSPERHRWALELTKGYCRIVSTAALASELARLDDRKVSDD